MKKKSKSYSFIHTINFILSLLLLPVFVEANEIIEFTNDREVLQFGNNISILEDREGKLDIGSVIASSNFIKSTKKVPNLGISSAVFWVRIPVRNVSNTSDLTIQLQQPTIDYVEFFQKDSTNTWVSTQLGDNKPFSARKYNSPNYNFNVQIPKGETDTFYLKVSTGEQLMLPLNIASKDKMTDKDHNLGVIFGIYFGIIFVMFLYNLFVYITVKDRSYLYYVIHTLLVGITQSSFLGYSFQYFWPEIPWLERISIYLFTCLVSIIGIQFMRSFLHTSVIVPKLDRIFKIFFVLYTICILLSFGGQYNISYNLIQMVQSFVAIYILTVAIIISKKGSRPAKYYLAAWSILMIGILIFALKDFGILPYNNFTSLTMVGGSALEVILLSFALADKINIFKKEKEDSQAQALSALRENERIIREQNVILEEKVKERTIALEDSNRELNITYTNLKDAQAQLVNAEKMASLGQLTAGIAHEINNPINFVSSNVNPLRRDINDMLTLLDKYEEIKTEENISDKISEIERLKKELDVPYMVEEMKSLLNGIEEGAKRTSEIVKGLKNFSRLDETDLKNANINEGLDSTLSILRSGMNDSIKIVKEYSNLPEIECYAGKLNQVFMNILNNSMQAIFARKSDDKTNGVITIKTFDENENISISIHDNGIGIPENIKDRIFEPFFTTKDVGEGTGLGLSIVYNIIENHNGTIKVKSTEGVGTEFIITLPKSQHNMN